METLTPSILEMRNSFLEQFKNDQLETISKKLDDLFDVEKDQVKRIVLLASRVETIRKRIDQIHQDENKTKIIQKSSNESANESANEEKVVQSENDSKKLIESGKAAIIS